MRINKKQKIEIKDCKEIWEKHEKYLDNLDTAEVHNFLQKKAKTECTSKVVTDNNFLLKIPFVHITWEQQKKHAVYKLLIFN